MRMNNSIAVGALSILLLTTGCSDSRLSGLSEGINRDSVATLLEAEAPDHQQSFLVGGVFWEILYFGAEVQVDSTTDLRTLAPVVMSDGKVAGWGWGFLDETAYEAGFRVPQPREQPSTLRY
jgi:hypothetical protein